MNKLLILNNYFFNFKFFFINNNLFLLNNNFFLILYFFKIFKLYKYFFIIKKFYIYSFGNVNKFFINFLNKFFINVFLKVIYLNLGFVYFRFFFKIGLGFRKKYLVSKEIFAMYIGGRHWILFKIKTNFFFNMRRKNILILTQSRKNLNYYSNAIKHIRKESIFKTKGVMFKRLVIKRKRPRSILFARRIKFARIKLKLSKKQKLV